MSERITGGKLFEAVRAINATARKHGLQVEHWEGRTLANVFDRTYTEVAVRLVEVRPPAKLPVKPKRRAPR